ncbi:MAG: VCBS repeat-containing protein, partial [Actinobacteria bacterium]
ELVFAGSDGLVHAWRRDGSELPGWPVRTDQLPLVAHHSGARAFSSGEVSSNVGGAVLSSVAAADLNGDGVPEVVATDFEGKVYAWDAAGHRLWTREANPDYSGRPLTPFVNVRQGETNRTQHGFIASPVIADLDGDGKPEVIAAGMDRHLYAWHADGSPVDGFPVLVVDRSKVASIDPTTHRVQFKSGVGADLQQGPIVDTAAVGDITGDGQAEIVVGTNEEYTEPLNVGNFELSPAFDALSAAGAGDLGKSNSRLFAIKSTGDDHASAPRPDHNEDAFLDHWPFAVAQLQSDLLPVVGEGITGAPVIGPASMDCGANGGTGPKVGVIPDAGLGYVLNKDASSCAGSGADGKPNAMRTENGGGSDHPVFPAVGHPAFGAFGGGVSFLAPVAGLIRALDVVASEYQVGGQDSLSAWDPPSGTFRANTPVRMNDLQFLTGPSVSDVDPSPTAPGEEMLGGSAYLDLQAYTASGQPAAGFPKLTSDWMVANPLVGSFGTLDTQASARKTIVALTRNGTALAYSTAAGPCSASSWPRFHHDNANSGYYDRDAVAPGRPDGARIAAGSLTFTAPGDDLMCGRVSRYQLVQSDSPITAANFGQAAPLTPAQPVTPVDPGTTQTIALPAGTARYVAVRAVDDQDNVGRPATVKVKSR